MLLKFLNFQNFIMLPEISNILQKFSIFSQFSILSKYSILSKFLKQNFQNSSKISTYLSETKLVALNTTSSAVLTITGTFRHPGDFRILTNIFRLSWRMLAGHISILVTTTKTGTDRANAKPRCSFVIPIIPAFAPI